MSKHDFPFMFISGPCVIENEEKTFEIASKLKEMASIYDIDFIFKASFDKANRTSIESYRGPGIEEGLRILAHVKKELDIQVTSDVHEVYQVELAADVLDVIQIPAFLCRQTDLLVEAGRTMKIVNLKKAQFIAPEDMKYAVQKVESTGNSTIFLTERGSTFGYHNLVVDFRSFSIMSAFGYPVIFDVSHSVQIPSQGGASSGRREYVLPLARSAAAYGIDGLFTEVHPDPELALSDGPNSLYLDDVPMLLKQVADVRKAMEGNDDE